MSNYCACSGGDEEYTIELNQQGPEGPQGPVGPEGFSPSISIKTNTDKEYVLTVVNKEGNFDTPNLYGEKEKLNADLSNIPNPAIINGVSLSHSVENISSIEIDGSRITTGINGSLVLSAISDDDEATETFNYEVVANPKEQRLELHDKEGNVKIVATTDYIPTINVATTEVAGIVKPDGSTITVGVDGTISAVQPDLSNYVTNDELSVDLQDINSKIASKLDTATYEADKTSYATKEELASTDATVTNLQTTVASNTTSIGALREDLSNLETTVGNNSADIAALDADKLASSNIIAGANITIDRNGNNLTINSIGGGGSGGASIDDSSISSATTWSSSKINSEITTVANTKNNNIFDISKFTVVGSPTITDEGVASGFDRSNYLTVDTSIFANDITDFDFYIPFNVSKITTKRQHITRATYNGSFRFLVCIDTDGAVKFNFSTINSETVVIPSTVLTLNKKYVVKLSLHNGVLEYGYFTDNTYTKSGELELSYIAPMDWFPIGQGSLGSLTYGSIDLSHFSITVDGENIFNGLMESTKPIYDKITTTNTALTTFQTDTDNNFSAVNSALNEKANLSDLAGYVTVNKYNELLARVTALETEINGGNA